MQEKNFRKNDAGFICKHCNKVVSPLGYSSRNHCPFCLYSLHVDIMPGDRNNPCGGSLRPQRADPDPKRGFILTHKCERCGEVVRCKVAEDDDRKKLIALTAGVYIDENG